MSGSENRRLTLTTSLRLSEAEAEALREAAEGRGLGPSALARVLVVEGIGRPVSRTRRRRTELAKTLQAIGGEVARVGNNANQIARVAHMTRDPAAIAVASSLVGEIEGLILAVLALGEDA